MKGLSMDLQLQNTIRIRPMMMLPMIASGIIPAASTMPPAIAQKRNAMSIGSLIAVLKRTIESAPTIPRERTTLDVTASMTIVVIIVMATREPPNVRLNMTPLYVFL